MICSHKGYHRTADGGGYRACTIIPPHILEQLAKTGDVRALRSLRRSHRLRERRIVAGLAFIAPVTSPTLQRAISDAQNLPWLPGKVVRTEGKKAVKDKAANRAYDGSGHVYKFYKAQFGRNSLDGNGMVLKSTIHYDQEFNNAFWDGEQMVYGDGDNSTFTDFTLSLDVIAHEMTHGLIEQTADLAYENQSGALNESFADVFGVTIRQQVNGEDGSQQDHWKLGKEIFTPAFPGDALRDVSAPGTAYSHPLLGDDPQPAHVLDFKFLPNTKAGDWGGVHINSGIPNRAFYGVYKRLGTMAAADIWYRALLTLSPFAQFRDAYNATIKAAKQSSAPNAVVAVQEGWGEVKIPDDLGHIESP